MTSNLPYGNETGCYMRAYSVADIGRCVRNARKAAGLTQRELAEACLCGVRFISDLENGKPTIELGKALRVLNTLSLDIDVVRR